MVENHRMKVGHSAFSLSDSYILRRMSLIALPKFSIRFARIKPVFHQQRDWLAKKFAVKKWEAFQLLRRIFAAPGQLVNDMSRMFVSRISSN